MNSSNSVQNEEEKRTITIVASASVVMLSVLPSFVAWQMSGPGAALGVFLFLLGSVGAVTSLFLFYRHMQNKIPQCTLLNQGACLMGLEAMDDSLLEAEIIAYLKSRGVGSIQPGDLTSVIMAAKHKAKKP